MTPNTMDILKQHLKETGGMVSVGGVCVCVCVCVCMRVCLCECKRVPPLCERFWVLALPEFPPCSPNITDRSSRGSLLSPMESCTSDTQRPSISTLDMQRFPPLSPSTRLCCPLIVTCTLFGNRGWYVRFCCHGDAVSCPRPTMVSPTSATMTPTQRRRRRGSSEASGRWWSGSVRGGWMAKGRGVAEWLRGGQGLDG